MVEGSRYYFHPENQTATALVFAFQLFNDFNKTPRPSKRYRPKYYIFHRNYFYEEPFPSTKLILTAMRGQALTGENESDPSLAPRLQRQVVNYPTTFPAGTV